MASTVAVLAISILAGIAAYIHIRRVSPVHYCTDEDHRYRVSRILNSLKDRPPGSKISLHRHVLASNTIRNESHKYDPTYFPIDLSSFNHIIRIDHAAGYVDCETGVPFGVLLPELIKVGLTTLVVPELPGITVGGAIAGGGLESSSHRYGQVSDSVLEIECLTPQHHVCSPEIRPDLFYAISASYNTCALITRVKLRVTPAPRYVSLKAVPYDNSKLAVEALRTDDGSDTIEGIAYSPTEILIIRGTHTQLATSPVRRFNRHWHRWYYKTIRATPEFTVPYLDYCFRYNYGSFWMADYVLDMLGGDNLATRFAIGSFLDTKHLFAVLHSGSLADLGRMRVIQDCYIPVDRATEFLEVVDKEIGVYPIWLCPVKGTSSGQVLASHYTVTEDDFINVGIYGRPRLFPFDAQELHSRVIECLIHLGGRPMLYAQTWHTPDQFGTMYGNALGQVEAVKGKYGEPGCYFGLYEKVALSADDREELQRPMMGSEAEETRKVVMNILRKRITAFCTSM